MPLGGPSLIAQWFVMKKAKDENIKVLLDGQGADEILGGYPRYIDAYLNEMIFSVKPWEIFKYYSNLKQNGFNLKRIVKKIIRKNKEVIKFTLPITEEFQNSVDYKYRFIPNKYNSLPQLLKDEVEKSCLPSLLHIEDRNSMAHSVEARVPYLDHNLVEFSLSIPSEQKIHGTLTKIILRESMKNHIPLEVYNRTDKIGFATPIEKRISSKDSTFNNEIWDFIKNSKK